MPNLSVTYWLRGAIAFARHGWMMLGVALALIVTLEFGYRALNSAVVRLAGHPTSAIESRPDHPYAKEEWFELFQSPQEMGKREYRYDPYRGWWLTAKKSNYVNVSPKGTRLTLPAPSNPDSARRVFMLGGSTMWGITARDAYTIPSLTAARLKAREVSDVEIVNFAHAGFNSTQEAISVLIEIAKGNVPSVVVFLHGYNDIYLGLSHEEPGHAWDEVRTQQLLDLGRGNARAMLTAATGNLQLVQALRRAVLPEKSAGGEADRPASTCESIAEYYRNMTRSVKALGVEYGFTPVFSSNHTTPARGRSRRRGRSPAPSTAGGAQMCRSN